MNRVKIVYLDDELGNLQSFLAAFRRKYHVFTTHDQQEAIRIIKEEKPEIIITDQRMPLVTGVEFLYMAEQLLPESVKILTSAYSDISAIIDAVNKGHIYNYIKKPWDINDVSLILENAVKYYQANRTIRDQLIKLEKTNEELNRFVYSASHDLRSPITTIKGILQMAREDVSDPISLQYFNMIDESIARLDNFIRSIVQYYQNGKDVFDFQVIDFKKFIESVLREFSFEIEQFNISTHINVISNAIFVTDTFRLRIILGNIISNAIKFRKKNENNPTIEIDVFTDKNEAKIIIKDNGQGIMKDYQDKVFNMFFRVMPEISGNGIGLYLVKEAVEKLDGTIELNSEYQEGTTISLNLPNKYYLLEN
ncbi:histidine kinase [Schleiferia thermophila str. Yellowstone]|jgi:two-component system sensor histidine kinase/response regulator|uniref:hybrid sensor histidine kinase/response regulator n=1 Tax=Schleiferia thermophila TaxID=884107 RepID=UPI0004E7A5D1|nr:hybrid sensor histidine kinase/response regulator [Schleiferia thermophila]KFD39711.1 histidine kinase [Schleiferia thermophila str. Yellowstone]